MHRNPELEAAIFADPANAEAWQVYGDWLQERDDPRGELISLEVQREDLDARAGAPVDERIEALMAAHRETWLGDAAALIGADDSSDFVELSWDKGFVVEATITGADEEDAEGPSPDACIAALVRSPAALFLRKIVIGATYDDDDWMGLMDQNVRALISAGPLPALTEVEIHDTHNYWDISSTVVGDLDGLLAAAPRLRRLYVRGGDIGLTQLEHARLEELVIETGGLDARTAQAIARGRLPACRALTVYFGSSHYGGSTSIDDVRELLTGAGLPKLERLGLCNAEFQDELAAALADSPILAQLRELDLSLGTMTAAGAEAILAAADKFAHLERLDLSTNFIPPAQCDALRAALPSLDLDLGGERVARVYNDVPHYYVAVGE